MTKKFWIYFGTSIGVVVFSIAVMVITPIFVENYMWQIMLIPIGCQLPIIMLSIRMLIDARRKRD